LFDGFEASFEVSPVLLRNSLPLRIKELERVRFAEIEKPMKNFGRSARVCVQADAGREKLAIYL